MLCRGVPQSEGRAANFPQVEAACFLRTEPTMPRLVACPHCSCYAHPHEARCPECGASLTTGTSRRTAAALLLGLTAVTVPVTAASCDSEVQTEDDGSTNPSTTTTTTSVQNTTSTTPESVTAYGVGGFSTVGGGYGGFGGVAEGGASEGGAGQGGAQ